MLVRDFVGGRMDAAAFHDRFFELWHTTDREHVPAPPAIETLFFVVEAYCPDPALRDPNSTLRSRRCRAPAGRGESARRASHSKPLDDVPQQDQTMSAVVCMVLLGSALALSACTRHDAEFLTTRDDLREKVIAEMREVIPLVTKEHLEGCRSKLEDTSLLGAKYQSYGDFQPDILTSCMAQMSIIALPTAKPTAKRASYVIRLRQVASTLGLGKAEDLGVCVFEHQNSKTEMLVATRAVRIKYNNVCFKLRTA
jgi:hypothetical protein